jgi:hypothetical protein
MNRFLSTSYKLHRHSHDPTIKSAIEFGTRKTDFHNYLCSIIDDYDELTNFVRSFIEEHGQTPAFDLFESCEHVAKRSVEYKTCVSSMSDNDRSGSFSVRTTILAQSFDITN